MQTGSSHDQKASSSGRLRILLVDDDPLLLDTTAAILSDECDVVTAKNGQEALRLLGTQHFDVVCTDYRMPELDGIELLRKAASLPGEAYTCGVLVTGMQEYLPQEARKEGVLFSILLKPYDPQKLMDAVVRAAKLTRMKRAVASAVSSTEKLSDR